MVSLLVVDDETIIRRGLLTTLGKQEGLMVVGAAESGTDALRMVEQLQPDLVITDINMPNMDGLQLLEQLRAIDEDLTFIVLTGYDHFSYAQRALRAGAERRAKRFSHRGSHFPDRTVCPRGICLSGQDI